MISPHWTEDKALTSPRREVLSLRVPKGTSGPLRHFVCEVMTPDGSKTARGHERDWRREGCVAHTLRVGRRVASRQRPRPHLKEKAHDGRTLSHMSQQRPLCVRACVCERVCPCTRARPQGGDPLRGGCGDTAPPPRPHCRWTVPHKRGTRPAAVRSRPRPRAKGRTPSRRGQGPVPRPCDTGRFQHRTREPLPLWIRDAGGRGGGSSEPDGDPEGRCRVPLCAEIALGDNAEPQPPPGSRRTAVPALALATRPGERPPCPARHFAWVVCTGYGFASSGCGDPGSGAVDSTALRHSSSTLPAARSHPASRGFGNTKPHLLRAVLGPRVRGGTLLLVSGLRRPGGVQTRQATPPSGPPASPEPVGTSCRWTDGHRAATNSHMCFVCLLSQKRFPPLVGFGTQRLSSKT